MINREYNEIKIPENIDAKIDNGVKRALLEKSSNKKSTRKKIIGTTAASLAIILTLGLTSPALASRIPLIGNVFEAIEKNIHFPGEYSQYSTSINETAYSNGIGITLSEILCDGQSLYVTYIVESEKPFKYTSLGDNGLMDMNQLVTSEAYNKVDFTNEELDNSGFAGLEGKFINENTFVGVQNYRLTTLNMQIPDEFTFQTKIIALENYGATKNSIHWGTWAFKVPVKVNTDLQNTIALDNIDEKDVKINSISLTPFDMIIDVKYKTEMWYNYRTLVYDENGEIVKFSHSLADNDENTEKMIFSAPNSESIRIVIGKHDDNATTKESVTDIILDRVITLK